MYLLMNEGLITYYCLSGGGEGLSRVKAEVHKIIPIHICSILFPFTQLHSKGYVNQVMKTAVLFVSTPSFSNVTIS